MTAKCFSLSLLTLGLALASCNHNRVDEPTARISFGEVQRLAPTHTIAQLKALYSGAATLISSPVVIEAVVSSDDTEGNLYRTAYIQDATGGIELKLSLANLSTLYPQGSKIKLLAQGMTLGMYGRQVNLGYRSTEARYETSFYPELLVPKVLHKVSQGNLSPETLTIGTLNQSYVGKLIRLEGVQFLASELGQTYSDPTKAQANVNRTLVDKTGATLVVRTSSYAKFAATTLPEGSGSIVGILTYFNTTPQLLLLRAGDAQLTLPRF